MFTTRNTLAGAVLSAVGVVACAFIPTSVPAAMPAWFAMQHVWFLLAHLRLKDSERATA